MSPLVRPPRLPLLLGLALPLCLPAGARAQRPFPEDVESPLLLEPLEVTEDKDGAAGTDPTGLDGAEAERFEPPFAGELLNDVGFDEAMAGDIEGELAAAAAAGGNAAEIASGSERVDLRGFPTPMRRNGFTQAGVPEVLNPERSELILGSLVSPVGRSAPGGIRNIITPRPRGRVSRQFDVGFDTQGGRRSSARASGVVVPKKVWYQTSLGVSDRHGPQAFSESTQTSLSAALAVRHSRATSTLWQIDALDVRGNPAPGVPEYRESPGGPIVGPYRPLADFHAYGPRAAAGRQAVSLGFQLETRVGPELSLSSATQVFARTAEQDRFTTGQYIPPIPSDLDPTTINPASGRFTGVREPTHREEAFSSVTHQTDLTRRFSALGAEHKLRAGFEATLARASDENRGILATDRDTYLPADVQRFDPYDPNYYRPDYSPEVYRRIITDRENRPEYAALAADTRTALNRGRTVFTTGLRYDFSGITVNDLRPSAPSATAHADKRGGDLSYHAGINQRVGSSVLLFANASSAIEPSTRVDARTGAIQDNEATSGVEFGARTVLLERRLSVSAIVYTYTNTDIARRNPLYNDPVADPDQTQPQLVSSGEEEFRGLSIQAGWKPNPAWTLTGRAGWTDATTVSSPDIPEEEGLPLTRLPRFSAGAGLRHAIKTGRLSGFGAGVSVTHIGETVQNYARPDRLYLEHPAYTVAGLSADYTWPLGLGKASQTVSLSVGNAFDTDLLAKVARPGAGRSLAAGWRVSF